MDSIKHANYIKKPIPVKAFQWTGGVDQEEDPESLIKIIKEGKAWIRNPGKENASMIIRTRDGMRVVNKGDYIIWENFRKGEFYCCPQDIFEKSYEPINKETK